MFAFALLVATLVGVFSRHGAEAAQTAVRVNFVGAPAGSTYADSGHTAFDDGGSSLGAGGRQAPTCHAVIKSTGYVNPLAHAVVTPERIDQGVDYAGSGTLTAIGAAKVTYVATSGTGWPGVFIEYRLIEGPDVGCNVFYAEGVRPVHGLHVGQTVAPGQPIATIIPDWSTGIEIGWGAGVGTETYAANTTGWSAQDDAHDKPSDAGRSFSALIASLGGPPGKVEG
jgi:hypothetical protein